MDAGRTDFDTEIDQVVRRYLGRVAVRSLPGVALAAAVVLILVLVPGAGTPTVATGSGPRGGPTGSPSPGAGAGGPGAGAPAPGGGGTAAGPSPAGSPGSGPGMPASGPTPTGSGGPAGPSGTGGAAGTTTGGVARTGVACAPGARQFTWSHYGPPCVAAFHGADGGATAHGVTGTTITISYRNANSAQQAAVSAAAGGATPSDASYVADMSTYINWFNTQFELYGRHVVLKPFNGQGDYVAEDAGQDPAGAQADAVTAHDLGAFIDATFVVEGSQLYAQDLAAEHVINWDGPALPESWYQQYSPWEYNYTATGDNTARWFTDVVCQRMAGLPAIFAGDQLMRGHNRVFGIVSLDNPLYLQSADYIRDHLQSQCGTTVARLATYSENTATMETDSASIDAQMRGGGVTTVICFCDPLMPIFLSNSADQQQFRPEWLEGNDLDPVTRDYASDQWAHAISNGGQWPAAASSEAHQAFERADPGGQPAEQYYPLAYYTLVQIFDALQAAGPDLTPETFQRGMFSLPQSLPGGEVGTWRFGPGAYTPQADAQVGWWNPAARSNFDGKTGAWESCDGGAWYPFASPSAYGGPRQQLACF